MFPDITGPRPLLLPATATKTVGTPSPEEEKTEAKRHVSKASISHTYLRQLTFVFGFDAERLVGAFVRRGDSQGAGNPEGAAGLADFFAMGHV